MIHRETVKRLTDFYVDTFLPEILTRKCLDDTPEASEESNSDNLYCIRMSTARVWEDDSV